MGTCHKMMILIIIGIVPMVRYIKLSVSGKTLGPQLILDLISLSPSSWDPPHPPPPLQKNQHFEESNKPNTLFAK